jgi:hypothetical protein
MDLDQSKVGRVPQVIIFPADSAMVGVYGMPSSGQTPALHQ